MTPNLIIGISGVAATAAGLACAVAHWWAKKRRWAYVPRYVTGTLIGLIAIAAPLFAALDVPDAVLLYGMCWLIFGAMGIATFLAHDGDPDPPHSLTPEADRLLSAIDEELRK
jgi:hypothetical protein